VKFRSKAVCSVLRFSLLTSPQRLSRPLSSPGTLQSPVALPAGSRLKAGLHGMLTAFPTDLRRASDSTTSSSRRPSHQRNPAQNDPLTQANSYGYDAPPKRHGLDDPFTQFMNDMCPQTAQHCPPEDVLTKTQFARERFSQTELQLWENRYQSQLSKYEEV
jgi:hypothetical protein